LSLDLITVIGTYGFPIFVSLWFMYRIEKVLNNNTQAMKELINVVQQVCVEVRQQRKD
jgi:hypothetical protein